MRATGDQLDERFLIPIARELAVGLRAIHDAGVIHRDIKGSIPCRSVGSKLTCVSQLQMYLSTKRGGCRYAILESRAFFKHN